MKTDLIISKILILNFKIKEMSENYSHKTLCSFDDEKIYGSQLFLPLKLQMNALQKKRNIVFFKQLILNTKCFKTI